MKKIYITDLDHTFLRSDLTISDYTKKIWNSYATHSIMSVATARTYKKTMQFLEGIELNAPMILLDGALIATREKSIIDTKFIAQDDADAIINEGAKLGIYPFVITLADAQLNELFLHSNKLNAIQEQVLKRYSKDDNLTPQHNLRAMRNNFKIVYMGEESQLRELDKNVRALFGESFQYILAPEAYMNCYFLTILHKDADKAHGIRSVSEYLGFDLAKLTVFGDNYNDLGMFALAANAVAVANAQEGVKREATITLNESNNEDGVARYLERLTHD